MPAIQVTINVDQFNDHTGMDWEAARKAAAVPLRELAEKLASGEYPGYKIPPHKYPAPDHDLTGDYEEL